MKSSGVILIAMAILTFFSPTSVAAVEDDFWKWFQKNQEMIFHFENDTERTFDKLSDALSKVDPELTFEFSPILEDGKREFVISAGGIKSAFPSVEKLANSAPDLVILPFLTEVKSRVYAAINGGFPPLALCGRS